MNSTLPSEKRIKLFDGILLYFNALISFLDIKAEKMLEIHTAYKNKFLQL